MRTLLIESTPRGATAVAGTLEASGHDVVRCHHVDGPAVPCAGLTTQGCPLEAGGPVDVAIAVHDPAEPEATAREAGATCAVRTGIPLLVVGRNTPFDRWADATATPTFAADDLAEELATAVQRAIVANAVRRAGPMAAEVRRVLQVEGIDGGEVRVDVVREGDTAHALVHLEQPVPERVAGIIATRVHAVDQQGSWPTTKLAVAVLDGSPQP
jgi:hypothetical protein